MGADRAFQLGLGRLGHRRLGLRRLDDVERQAACQGPGARGDARTDQEFAPPDALAVLIAHPWPGNVRELENVIERAMVLTRGERIEKSAVADGALAEARHTIEQLHADRPPLEKLEERYIKLILSEVNDSKDAAAKILGVSRRTLYRKERLYGTVDSIAIVKSG